MHLLPRFTAVPAGTVVPTPRPAREEGQQWPAMANADGSYPDEPKPAAVELGSERVRKKK